MRNSGGRTKSRGSLSGNHEGRTEAPRAQQPVKNPGADSARSAAGASDLRRPAINSPKRKAATAVAVALSTSLFKSTPKKKSRKHLEVFVPLQRHLYGDERVILPCPGSKQ